MMYPEDFFVELGVVGNHRSAWTNPVEKCQADFHFGRRISASKLTREGCRWVVGPCAYPRHRCIPPHVPKKFVREAVAVDGAALDVLVGPAVPAEESTLRGSVCVCARACVIWLAVAGVTQSLACPPPPSSIPPFDPSCNPVLRVKVGPRHFAVDDFHRADFEKTHRPHEAGRLGVKHNNPLPACAAVGKVSAGSRKRAVHVFALPQRSSLSPPSHAVCYTYQRRQEWCRRQ